jgi:drug/metabolite transporter (DMT)-like permease
VSPSRTWPLYVSLVVASLLWGSLYPAAKPLVAATGPMQVTLVRAVLACLTLGLLVFLRQGIEPFVTQIRTRWPGILALAVLSFSGSTILAMIASNLLPASVNGLLNNTHPLWIAAGTAVLYPPRRPALLIGGSLLALLGVALVFFPDLSLASLGDPGALNLAGVVVSLAGSGVIALSNVVGRRTMPGGEPLAILALASAAAIPPLVALTLVEGGFAPIFDAALDVKLLLLYVGIGCTAINFSLWYSALKHLRAAQAAAFQYLIPPTGVVIAAALLHEPITAGLAIGGVLILAGLVTTQFATAATRAPAHLPVPDLVAPEAVTES